jgi:hypothetical protein
MYIYKLLGLYIILILIVIVLPYFYDHNYGYKYKLKYLLTDELTQLCNKTKDRDNNIMIMMFNRGHIDEARNCIHSYKKSTNKNNILVFALDKETKKAMDKENISCYYNRQFYNSGLSDSDYATNDFDIICYNKLLVIFSILKNNTNCLWSDTDIVYFKNPFNKFKTMNKSILIQNAGNSEKGNLCAGFMYFKNNNISTDFLEKCINFINDGRWGEGMNADQGVINHLKDLSKIDILPMEEFPDGKVWWGHPDKNVPPLKNIDKSKAFIIHNNWIKGLDNKVKRFKENELWYI